MLPPAPHHQTYRRIKPTRQGKVIAGKIRFLFEVNFWRGMPDADCPSHFQPKKNRQALAPIARNCAPLPRRHTVAIGSH
jgi:hypothetical protein